MEHDGQAKRGWKPETRKLYWPGGSTPTSPPSRPTYNIGPGIDERKGQETRQNAEISENVMKGLTSFGRIPDSNDLSGQTVGSKKKHEEISAPSISTKNPNEMPRKQKTSDLTKTVWGSQNRGHASAWVCLTSQAEVESQDKRKVERIRSAPLTRDPHSPGKGDEAPTHPLSD
jgi:hypothetical protein